MCTHILARRPGHTQPQGAGASQRSPINLLQFPPPNPPMLIGESHYPHPPPKQLFSAHQNSPLTLAGMSQLPPFPPQEPAGSGKSSSAWLLPLWPTSASWTPPLWPTILPRRMPEVPGSSGRKSGLRHAGRQEPWVLFLPLAWKSLRALLGLFGTIPWAQAAASFLGSTLGAG